MARICHTADVHLARDAPERREALEAVFDAATEIDADLVTIGGDCFDSEADAEALRGDLRRTFADLSFPVLAIPGNHDEAAYRDDVFFGSAFEAVVGEPFEHVRPPGTDVRITCLPYTPYPDPDLLVALAEREPFDGYEALLLHCSLEAPFDASDGDEDDRRYFPVTKTMLAELDFDAYLAGHYHSAHEVALSSGGTFLYPGTPASVTSGETGPRTVAVVDTDRDAVERHPLASFHYDHLAVDVAPAEEAAALERIADWVDERRDRDVEASITVSGHVRGDEAAFAASLADASGDVAVHNRTTGVDAIVSHPLYEDFEATLAERDLDPALEADVRERTIRAFSELAAEGRL